MIEWVIASGNAGKLREFSGLLGPFNIQTRPMSDFDVAGADETGLSFVENALLKARHVAAATGRPALADDSGIAVDALDGAPGIHSARYAGAHGNDGGNLVKLLADMQGQNNRAAQFICVLAVCKSATDPMPLIAQGIWRGQLLDAPAGDGGFGYDPIFQPDGLDVSAAQLSGAEKSAISHRALAVASLKRQLLG
ncbi:RdgB/HAM1 family non-canonical purine NTP pyrophosphatase [Litorivicinus lipolyticus]|uniref:dITP/XTP pyrophosphatase n=1 Tax=Litorivicinus lipolyticus TaxID=418701 RepID=A0A5Q2QB78_9GAMM|nr:RdgB/HAM1 family non-canonical purine NTP pyrophosphatase [Litorivicinus lipolyticus]QGG79227.1 RdgB/HAM1 family non-canonical purine NTP pyrophosphatase [Litorivicinus lipolyticus]